MQYWCELCVFDLLQLIRELNLLSLLSKLAFAAQSLAIPTPEDFYLFALCSPLTRVLDSPGDLGTCICGRGGGGGFQVSSLSFPGFHSHAWAEGGGVF